MAIYGYARVSSIDQDLTIQRDKLKAAGCTVIRAEKVSGTSRKGRTELETLLEFLQRGDTLIVVRIDRLARSMLDLQTIVADLNARGVELRCTDQAVDTTTPEGKALLGMLGVFAEFETNLRRERQLDGIAKAKVEGVYKGRKPTIDVAAVRRLKDEGKGASEIAKALGIGRASVYRVIQAA
jgi:DNA invertase Pin-like site-specific DNA recombinase